MGANVQILSLPDSALVTGDMANNIGAFSLKNLTKDHYVLKISFMGYETLVVNLELNDYKSNQIDLGYITLVSDQKMLQETVVSTNVSKIQVSGDSLQFNASAYRVPQGSSLEALVKLLPGAEIDENGAITINGKSVTKILVDGKEFFLNDISVAMRNIPVEIIEKVKTYQRKSDMARITGIDDGEDETVLDLSVKKGMNSGWFGNVLGGLGTPFDEDKAFNQNKYTLKEMVNYFNDNTTVTAIGNVRNVSEQRGWARPGLFNLKEGGLNFASQNEVMETGGSVSYRYEGSDIYNNFHATTTDKSNIYSVGQNHKFGSNHGLDAQFKMEWRPDSMTTVLFRPSFTYKNMRAYYYEDGVDSSLDLSSEVAQSRRDTLTSTLHDELTRTTSTYAQGDLQVTRRFGKKGRSLTLRVLGDYTQSEAQQLSAAKDRRDDRDTINNRYYDTPAHNYMIATQVAWSEPLGNNYFLNFNYRYSYHYAKNDRQAFLYDYVDKDELGLAYSTLQQNIRMARYDVDHALSMMRDNAGHPFNLIDAQNLSQFSERKTYKHRIGIQLRKVSKKVNLAVGVTAFPNKHTLSYRYMGQEYPNVSRHIINVIPRLNLRINFDKATNLQVKYDGKSAQPNMADMLDLVDDSNPLRLKKGNPGLKPSFTHTWDMNFNTFNADQQRGLWAWCFGSMVENAIGNHEYRDTAAVKTITPVNVNGNWNMGTGVGVNQGLGKEKHFSVGGSFGVTYNQYAGYYKTDVPVIEMVSVEEPVYDEFNKPIGTTWVNQRQVKEWYVSEGKSVNKNTTISSHLNAAYRNDFISIDLRGWLDQIYTKSNVNKNADVDAQNIRYGGEVTYSTPFGLELATNIYQTSRRGYSLSAMNTDELLWNASISYSCLKGRALTFKGEVFDILGQRTCINRSYSAAEIRETFSNGVYQYGLFTVIYRFSVFAGRNTMGTKDERKSDAYARRVRPSW